MKRTFRYSILMTLIVLLSACSTDQPVTPDLGVALDLQRVDPAMVAAEILSLTGWSVVAAASPGLDPDKNLDTIMDFSRREVASGIFHYRWEIQVGTGGMDVIALHRVVKENQGDGPIRARKSVFLQHGDAKDFTGMFLPGTLSATTPDDFGAAIYWARRNVDVWGIDQAWNLVPAETADFGFMADWGMEKQATDLGTAIAIARQARLATGNGYRQMILLGYSSGSATGYALINAETQLPPGQRQVGAWIPVDYSPVTDTEDWNEIANCGNIPELQGMMDSGEYGYFVGFDFLGNLAHDDPDGDSPVFPGFTNLQTAMFVGAGPVFGVGDIHYLAGIWQNGMPVDFVHTTVDKWLDFMMAGSPWEPAKYMLDYSYWGCGEVDVPWDDHFGEITVPVLNVAAAGGIGPTTQYCLGLLGSRDITDMNIQLRSTEEALFDFGHIDLWIADNAPELVWDPVLEWIEAHTAGGKDQGNFAHRN